MGPAQSSACSDVTSSLPTPPLSCTVRDCGLLLERRGNIVVCARQHAYDVARSGYVNLLQPQDRRSRHAGDTAGALAARARLLGAGVGRSILNRFVDRAAALLPAGGVVVDLGSGAGDVLGELAARVHCLAVGIDLSTAAADHAARHFPGVTWLVANADRRLPLLDRTADLILSLHGRRHPAECARVLPRTGHLLVAVPAADDLIELRTAVLGHGVERERSEALIAEHAQHFEAIDRFEARERQHVARDHIRDLLRGTYRGRRPSTAQAIETLGEIEVTLASTVVLFRPRTP
jgi:23S rRNA (guanine745-N1)-methyltransferase